MTILIEETCCSCFVSFGISPEMRDALLKCHNTFYCPQGHAQHFTGESGEEKLKRLLEDERRTTDILRKDNAALSERIAKAERKAKRNKAVRHA